MVKIFIKFFVVSIFFMNANLFADTIMDNYVKVKSGDQVINYDIDVVALESDATGAVDYCPCRMLSFRALQVVAKKFDNATIPKDDIKIFTGWTTDGPEELFIEEMGWPSEDLSFTLNATATAYLTSKDMVFYFVQKSSNKVWKVWGNNIHSDEFFKYRTLIKSGAATSEQKNLFKNVIKKQAIINLATLPLVDKFYIEEIPSYNGEKVLSIPSLFLMDGMEYKAKLKYNGKNFDLINE